MHVQHRLWFPLLVLIERFYFPYEFYTINLVTIVCYISSRIKPLFLFFPLMLVSGYNIHQMAYKSSEKKIIRFVQDEDRTANPPVPASPDPAVRFKWKTKKETFQQLPILPVDAKTNPEGILNGIKSLLTKKRKVIVSRPGTLILDFGRELAGWVEIELEVDKNLPEIKIRVGEAKTPQSNFPTKLERKKNRAIYRLCPTDGYTGFRFAWIQFKNLKSPVKLVRAEAIWKLYPLNYEGSFQCSDELLTKIWYACVYTARLCLDPKQVGAILRPERGDRYGWMGDSRITHVTMYYAFGNYEIVKKDLESYVKPGQKQILINRIPGFTLDWVISVVNYYLYSGDQKEFIKRIPDIETILKQYSTAKTPHGWLFTDWEKHTHQTRGHTKEQVAAFHAKYVHAARAAAWALDKIGKKALGSEYLKLAAKREKFIKNSSWIKKMGIHTITNAILADMLTDKEWKDVSEKIMKKPFTITPFFTFFVLQALAKRGQQKKALETLRNYWGGMIRLGATSMWECFDPKWEKSIKPFEMPPNIQVKWGSFWVSLCHPWSSGAAVWLSREVLGVKPKEPGFTRCEIVPFTGNLKWAKGTVPTPHGLIHVSWKRDGNKFSLEISVPRGVHITAGVPAGKKITINGKPALPSRKQGNTLYFDLSGSGKFVIHSQG